MMFRAMTSTDTHGFQSTTRVAVALAGLGMAAAVVARWRAVGRSSDEASRLALVTYLDEHLSGADTAIQVVGRLQRTLRSADDRRFFESFYEELLEDRNVVKALLAKLGSSPLSTKRLALRATGALLKFTAGGRHGELSMFRTLEGLLIGIQGKRCLWRTLQAMPHLSAPGARTFEDLEASALQQWDAIEERRRSLVHDTFSRAGARSAVRA